MFFVSEKHNFPRLVAQLDVSDNMFCHLNLFDVNKGRMSPDTSCLSKKHFLVDRSRYMIYPTLARNYDLLCGSVVFNRRLFNVRFQK